MTDFLLSSSHDVTPKEIKSKLKDGEESATQIQYLIIYFKQFVDEPI